MARRSGSSPNTSWKHTWGGSPSWAPKALNMSGLLSRGSHFLRKNLSPIFLLTCLTASAAPPSAAPPLSAERAATHAVRTHPAYPSAAPAFEAPAATADASMPSTTLTLSSDVPRETSLRTFSTLSWNAASFTPAAVSASTLPNTSSLLRVSTDIGVPVTSFAIQATRSACARATAPPVLALCFSILVSRNDTGSSVGVRPMPSLSAGVRTVACATARILSKASTMGPMTTLGNRLLSARSWPDWRQASCTDRAFAVCSFKSPSPFICSSNLFSRSSAIFSLIS
mmetsp:Transcript_32765/g.82637  ORF Transcript_32765/g.82637 Transcript_32765/m.82637 type:complete len:284 (+) Transcript_32765:197-1048(+)